MAQGTKQSKEKNESNQWAQATSPHPAEQSESLARTDRSPGRARIARRERFPSWSPFELFDNFRTEMDRLFDDFGFGRGLERFGRADAFEWSPETEVFERGNELVVRADLPGLRKDDITVDLENNRVTIRGERKSEHEENKEGMYRSERSYGSFYRTIPLPEGVDGDKANADFRDGVLEITMPKPPEQKQRGRRLEIRSA